MAFIPGKSCFAYLVHDTPTCRDDFKKSLALLRQNHPAEEIVLFHETGYPAVPGCRMIPIQFEIPDWIDCSCMYGARLGYMHMCRFFAGLVFTHLSEYEYYCRLDTDSFILSPARHNLFTWAQANSVYYGYVADNIYDQPDFCTGLWDLASSFAELQETYVHPRNIPVQATYYTNFELCHVPWFLKNWGPWFDRVDKAGGFYYHRWGDHTVRRLGVQMLMPPAQIRRVPLHYRHTFEFNA